MAGVMVNGKLHCLHESCIHAKECPLTSLKPEKTVVYQPSLTVYAADRVFCFSYQSSSNGKDDG